VGPGSAPTTPRRPGGDRFLAATGPTRPDLSPQEAVDVVYALTSPELYDLLVRQSGWRPDRFQQWLVDSLRNLAFAPSPETPTRLPPQSA
jgi:hypothetical protein